ncbi:unnamed protein product [Dibothriocephalus latus]|uniref:Uncharacterized protein n=1 Tax=Dibothriocephalus latus TaxID=60516 RepID=A0A3P7LF92_DIBLA|nr:unnamed protein product [Dibothriocephalus latus]
MPDIPAAATDATDPDCGAKIKTISPTNAVGQLLFTSNAFPHKTVAEYIRLSDDNVDAAVDCLVGLAEEINACISVLTSSQPQQVNPEILTPLLDGLIEAAISSRALVLIDGFDTPPARDISKRLWMNQFVKSLGASKYETVDWAAIVPWGDVNDRDMLECQVGAVYGLLEFPAQMLVFIIAMCLLVKRLLDLTQEIQRFSPKTAVLIINGL